MEPQYVELCNCVLCPARYKYSPTKVIRCKACRGTTCKHHGEMVSIMRLEGKVYRIGIEWLCDECRAE